MSAPAPRTPFHVYTHESLTQFEARTQKELLDEKKYLDILNNTAQEIWPGLCCWWCTEQIPDDQQPMPMVIMDRRKPSFSFRGFFCSVNCTKSFCISRNVSFSPTRMYLSKIGFLAREQTVSAAPNYLDSSKYGPGTFRCQTRPYTRRTKQIAHAASSTNPPFSAPDTGPLRRHRKRHRGAGTLVPWLNNKNT